VLGLRARAPDRDFKVNLMQLALLIIVLIFVFEYAALRWGFASRDSSRTRRS